MSRSSYKFLPFFKHELNNYFFNLIEKKKISNYKVNRNITVNYWNIKTKVKIYQGRYNSIFKITKYHIGYKYSQLSKTRKPFFFRTKKKKR